MPAPQGMPPGNPLAMIMGPVQAEIEKSKQENITRHNELMLVLTAIEKIVLHLEALLTEGE